MHGVGGEWNHVNKYMRQKVKSQSNDQGGHQVEQHPPKIHVHSEPQNVTSYIFYLIKKVFVGLPWRCSG